MNVGLDHKQKNGRGLASTTIKESRPRPSQNMVGLDLNKTWLASTSTKLGRPRDLSRDGFRPFIYEKSVIVMTLHLEYDRNSFQQGIENNGDLEY